MLFFMIICYYVIGVVECLCLCVDHYVHTSYQACQSPGNRRQWTVTMNVTIEIPFVCYPLPVDDLNVTVNATYNNQPVVCDYQKGAIVPYLSSEQYEYLDDSFCQTIIKERPCKYDWQPYVDACGYNKLKFFASNTIVPLYKSYDYYYVDPSKYSCGLECNNDGFIVKFATKTVCITMEKPKRDSSLVPLILNNTLQQQTIITLMMSSFPTTSYTITFMLKDPNITCHYCLIGNRYYTYPCAKDSKVFYVSDIFRTFDKVGYGICSVQYDPNKMKDPDSAIKPINKSINVFLFTSCEYKKGFNISGTSPVAKTTFYSIIITVFNLYRKYLIHTLF